MCTWYILPIPNGVRKALRSFQHGEFFVRPKQRRVATGVRKGARVRRAVLTVHTGGLRDNEEDKLQPGLLFLNSQNTLQGGSGQPIGKQTRKFHEHVRAQADCHSTEKRARKS
jgi:hypothetical protein